MPPTPFIVICQSWPCWLSTILALCLPLHRAFFPKQFHDLFKLTGWASYDASWGTLEEINLPSSSSCFILGSGSYTFFQSFLETLHRNPCSFIFSLDVRFPHITQQDVKCQFHTWQRALDTLDFSSLLIAHADCGGMSSALHLIVFLKIDLSGVGPLPCVPCTLKHVLNAASAGGHKEVPPPLGSWLGSRKRTCCPWSDSARRRTLLGRSL